MNHKIMLKYEFVTNFEEEKKKELISMTIKNIGVILGHRVSDRFWESNLNCLFSNDINLRNNFIFVSEKCADIFDKAIQMSLNEDSN